VHKLMVVAASSVIAASLVGACGSDAKKSIPKAQYITQADAICKKYSDQANALKTPDSTSTDAQIKDFIHQGVLLEMKSLGELRALPNPDTDAAKFTTLYNQVEQRFKQLDAKSVAEIKSLPGSYMDDLNQQATALGLKECGQ
jgi:hypothetical protein